MGKLNKQHDIGFLTSTGTEIGLMLARSKNGVPSYMETTDEALAQQFFTGEPLYNYTKPERELPIAQEDFRAGFGLEYADREQPKRYFYSIGADARFKDKVILGPLPTTITKPTLPTVTDGELDVWAGGALTYWTAGPTGGAVEETSIKYSGTSSAKLTYGVGTKYIYQDLANWATDFRNKFVTVTGYVYCLVGDGVSAQIVIDDGVGETAVNVTADAAWHQVTVTRTLDAAASRLRVICRVTTTSGTTTAYFDLVEIAAYGSCVSQCDFNDGRWFALGKVLVKLNTTTGAAVTLEAIMPNTITQLYPVTVAGVDYLIVCQGWSATYYYLTTAGVMALTDLANSTAEHFVAVSNTFYQSDTNSTLRTTTNPLTVAAGGVAWSAQIQVGSDATDITNLYEYTNLCYIRKEDRPFYRDGSGNIQVLTDETANQPIVSGTEAMFVWHGTIYFSYGYQGLLAYDGSSISWVSPALFNTGASDFAGKITAITGDDQWLIVAMDNSTKVEILAGREEEVDGEVDFRWHPLAEITMTNCASAGVSGVYKKRLWAGSDTGTEGLYYVPLTTKYGSISSDSDYTYQTGGYIITPYMHGNFKNDDKAWVKITLRMSGTTAAIYWRAYYQKLSDSSWTEINSASKFKTSPATTAYIPVDGSSAVASSEMMRFKFEGVTNDTAVSPVLLGYDVRAVWYEPERKLVACQALVGDDIIDLLGKTDNTRMSVQKAAIEGINSSGYPRAFYPLTWQSATDTIYVKKLNPTKFTPQFNERGKLEYVCDLLLEVVTIS